MKKSIYAAAVFWEDPKLDVFNRGTMQIRHTKKSARFFYHGKLIAILDQETDTLTIDTHGLDSLNVLKQLNELLRSTGCYIFERKGQIFLSLPHKSKPVKWDGKAYKINLAECKHAMETKPPACDNCAWLICQHCINKEGELWKSK